MTERGGAISGKLEEARNIRELSQSDMSVASSDVGGLECRPAKREMRTLPGIIKQNRIKTTNEGNYSPKGISSRVVEWQESHF